MKKKLKILVEKSFKSNSHIRCTPQFWPDFAQKSVSYTRKSMVGVLWNLH